MWATVGDDLVQDSMEAEDLAIMDISDALRVDVKCGREHVDLLAIMVNVHYDGIILTDTGESHNQVDAYRFPGAFRDIVRLED